MFIFFLIFYLFIYICFLDPKGVDVGKGRLTERLLAQGILTPNMLQELKKEWDKQQDNSSSEPDDDPKRGGRRRRRWK